ncbi:MAG: proton-conducting transporter membrane subunit [Thermofilaceae archaeon]
MAQEVTFTLAAPLLFSLIALAVGRKERLHALIVIAGTGVTLFLSINLLLACIRGGVLSEGSLMVECRVTDAVVVVTSNFIAFLAAVYNFGLNPLGRFSLDKYGSLFLLLAFCFNYMVLVHNALMLFLLVEALIGVSVALVAHSTRSDALEVAFRYLVVTTLSAFFVLAGVALLFVSTGSYSLDQYSHLSGDSERLLALACILFVIGLGADIGFFPFHGWVPDAFPASTPIINVLTCAEHAPLFTGLYMLLLPIRETSYSNTISLTLATLGLVSIPISYTLAFRQRDAFRRIGYYTIGEYGNITLALGISIMNPASTPTWRAYLLNSSLMKAGILACLGLATATDNWEALPKRARELVSLSFVICSLSSVGIPPLSGFHVKLRYFLSVYIFAIGRVGAWAASLLLIFLLGMTFIPLYFLITLLHEFFLERLQNSGRGKVSLREVAAVTSCVTLAVVAVIMGLWPGLIFLE